MKNLLQKLFFKAPPDTENQIVLPGLERNDITVLQKYMQKRQFGLEEKIYQRGTPSAALYYINSGSIGLFTQLDDGHEERTQYIAKGRWFGVSALLENELRPHTARSLEETELFVLSTSELTNLFAAKPIVGNRFLLTIIGELHAAQVEMDSEYFKLLSRLTKSNIIV